MVAMYIQCMRRLYISTESIFNGTVQTFKLGKVCS